MFKMFWTLDVEVFGKIIQRHNLFQSFASIGHVDLVAILQGRDRTKSAIELHTSMST